MLLGLLLAAPLQAQSGVPVPRAEAEFRHLVNATTPEAEAIQGDVQRFIMLALPYSPLDLRVTKAATPGDAQALRNFFLGVMGGAAQVDVLALTTRFHCGPPCAEQRRRYLQGQLADIHSLVEHFRAAPDVHTLAQWSPDEYRVNHFFFRSGEFSESIPSPVFGLVPSGDWVEGIEPEVVLRTIGVSRDELDQLVGAMRRTDLAALVRDEDGSVRAVWAGVSDNEAGLLFIGTDPPAVGDVLPEGGEYVLLEEVETGVWFYTTS